MADDDPRARRKASGADGDRGAPDGEPEPSGQNDWTTGADADADHTADRATEVGRAGDRSAGADAGAGPAVGAAAKPTGPMDASAPVPPRPPAWSGRAEVPVRRPNVAGEPTPAYWSQGAEPDDRRWWMPIVIGVIALLLLTVLVVVGWLIFESTRSDPSDPPPPPVTTPAATPAPTSAAPTTTAPSPTGTPSATAAATVAVPALVGLPEQEAVELLERADLVPRAEFRASDRSPGTVLETDPSAGAQLAPGDQVTLVIAEPRPEATTAGPTIPTPPTPND